MRLFIRQLVEVGLVLAALNSALVSLCQPYTYSQVRPPAAAVPEPTNSQTAVLSDMLAQADQLAQQNRIEAARAALIKYSEAFNYASVHHDWRNQIRALQSSGSTSEFLDESKAALNAYQRALTLAEREHDQNLTANLHNQLALLFAGEGDNRKALNDASVGLQLGKQLNDRATEAQALYVSAEATYNVGDLHSALDLYNRSLTIWRELQNKSKQAEVLIGCGYTYSNISEPQKALASYNEAMDLSKSSHNSRMEALAQRGLGNLQTKQGQPERALTSLFQSLRLLEGNESRLLHARVYAAIGYAYENLGDITRALDYDSKAATIFHEIGNPWGEAELLWDIGHLYFLDGNDNQALEHSAQALTLFTNLKMPRFQAQTLRDMGLVYDRQGNDQKALSSFTQSLNLMQQDQDQRYRAYCLDYMGRIYQRSGKTDAARKLYQNALQLSRMATDYNAEAFTLYNMARLELRQGHNQESRRLIEEALKLTEDLRNEVANRNLRAAYVASVNEYYQFHVDVLMQSAKSGPPGDFAEKAFDAIEKAHARTLVESLKEARANLVQNLDPGLNERQRALQVDINAKAEMRMELAAQKKTLDATRVSDELNSLLAEKEQLETEIRRKDPRYATLSQPASLSLKDIQDRVLDDDSMLLEYMLGEERSYLWAITRTSIATYQLPARSQIEDAVKALRELLTSNQPLKDESFEQRQIRIAAAAQKIPQAAATVSALVLGPVTSQLGSRRLLVVPDGALQYIPFESLSVSGSNSNFAPLITNHEIVYEPSASALAFVADNAQPPAPNSVAVFANPVFEVDDPRVSLSTSQQRPSPNAFYSDVHNAFRDIGFNGDRIPPLPASGEEANGIVATDSTGHAFKALGFEANRTAVMRPELSQYRIVHFATHGFVDYEHPDLSGLVLSMVDQDGAPQDGFLRMHDIYNLKLPVDLVVLSACNTGLGKEVKGEGLIGLTRGFMYAGAKGVVASLWKVDDEATAELMKLFYAEMFQQGLTPAAALRQAQLDMWQSKRWHEPYYWAAFVIQGQYDQKELITPQSAKLRSLMMLSVIVAALAGLVILIKRRRRFSSSGTMAAR